jgi:hypothetical protein
VASPIGTGLGTGQNYAVPVLSSCSSMQYFFQLSELTGDGGSWDISLSTLNGETFVDSIPLCIISDPLTCTGTVSVTISAQQRIVLVFSAVNPPTTTKASWIIRCVAS